MKHGSWRSRTIEEFYLLSLNQVSDTGRANTDTPEPWHAGTPFPAASACAALASPPCPWKPLQRSGWCSLRSLLQGLAFPHSALRTGHSDLFFTFFTWSLRWPGDLPLRQKTAKATPNRIKGTSYFIIK